MAYNRSLIKDANNLMERILQPMSLPWTHKVVPVARNIPCDIDEMIDVVTADDGSHTPFDNGSFGFGQFETGRLRSGDSVIRLANSSESSRAASRRSTEPGIIEFSTVALRPELPSYHAEGLSMNRSPLNVGSNEVHNDDLIEEGATVLQCFEAIQELKRRKVEQARSSVSCLEISVKVNSSSSRSSIFTSSKKRKLAEDEVPVVLDATLPLEVEIGKKVSKIRAKAASEKLGSYNIQHGQPPLQPGKNPNRTLAAVGRTRLVWTSKLSPDQPQRSSYVSLVTGQTLESGAEKRPRNVRVRIRVNGDLLRDQETTGCGRPGTLDLQASLQCDQLVQNLLDKKSGKINSPYLVPPSIECVPDSAGSIHVVCTSPGSILQSSVNPVLKLARNKPNPCCTICWRSTEGGLEVKECSKCGLLAHLDCCLDQGESRVVSASDNQTRKEEWTCSVCCYHDKNYSGICEPQNLSPNTTAVKKSRRKSRPSSKLKDPHFQSTKAQKNGDHSTAAERRETKCSICLLSGGAMSRIFVGGEECWVHEICRIWSGDQRHSSNSRNQSCVLCGVKSSSPIGSRLGKDESMQHPSLKSSLSRCVIKCAAPGCHISVHPMCALVSSLASKSTIEERDEKSEIATLDNIQKAKKRDVELCSQYTLTFASVCGLAHSFGKDPGAKFSAPLPIIFCGIHNPAREQSFHGLYPGGESMDIDQTLKVPSC